MMEDLKILNREGNFTEICTYWDQREVSEAPQKLNAWDYLYCINALYKQKRYQDCLKVYKESHNLYPHSKLLDNKMGWSVYQLYLKNYDFKNGDNQQYLQQVDYVLEHCQQEKYSPVTFVISQAVKAILEENLGKPIDYARINHYLDYLKVDKLTEEEHICQLRNGKTVRMASDKENWFNRKTKALYELKQYSECITCCNQALQELKRFHSNSDIWLCERKILSLLKMKKYDGAKAEMKKLLQRQHLHWSIYDTAFQIAVQENDIKSALQFAGQCALADLSHDMRMKFYADFAVFLHTQGMEDIAVQHRHLVDCLRREKKWKLAKWPTDWSVPQLEKNKNSRQIIKKLRLFWEKQCGNNKTFLQGKVKKLLGTGQSGFIVAEDSKDYYFNLRDVVKGRNKVAEGKVVKFLLQERLDRKKNRMSLAAIDIRAE